MANFLRLLLALAALPVLVGVVWAAPAILSLLPASSWTSPDMLAFDAGFAAFLAWWFFLPIPVRLYVLGHELTHAVWGLAFGARVSNLRVAVTGGSVSLSKSNVLITLAPYFFPFWTILVVVAALVTQLFVRPLPWRPVWMAVLGATWCFHLCFTLRTLMQRQPDVEEYGRLFSWVFIALAVFIGVYVALACTCGAPLFAVGRILCARVVAVYAGLYGSVRALPFLPQ